MDLSPQFTMIPAGSEGNSTPYNRLLATHEGKSIGNLDWHPSSGIIHSVNVREEHQGQGIATSMARHVAENHMGTYPNGKPIQLSHSNSRSAAGDAFANATRDFTYVPRNLDAPRRRNRAAIS